MPFPIARIDLATGLVVNIEMADQEWLDAHASDPDFTFEPYVEAQPAIIGLGYDPVTGFEQPLAPETLTVTVQQLEDAGLDAKAIESLSK